MRGNKLRRLTSEGVTGAGSRRAPEEDSKAVTASGCSGDETLALQGTNCQIFHTRLACVSPLCDVWCGTSLLAEEDERRFARQTRKAPVQGRKVEMLRDKKELGGEERGGGVYVVCPSCH